MKMLISMIITMGILIFGARFMLTGSDGVMDMFSKQSDSPQGIGELGNAVVKQDVTIYQWTDAEGVTHYGGTPPTNQGAYEKKEIRANTNVVQAYKGQEEDADDAAGPRIAKVGNPYSPEGIKDMINSSKDLQKQLNERTAEQEKMLQDMMGK